MLERLYPGVFLTEVPFDAKPIEGVATSTDHSDLAASVDVCARLQGNPAPEWTDANQHDPGRTLLHFHDWLGQTLLLHPDAKLYDSVRHVQALGVLAGLAPSGSGAGADCEVKVAPGLAIGPDGRGLAADASSSARKEPKP